MQREQNYDKNNSDLLARAIHLKPQYLLYLNSWMVIELVAKLQISNPPFIENLEWLYILGVVSSVVVGHRRSVGLSVGQGI